MLTPAQAAEQLNVSTKTVYNLISAREIDSVKVGRLVRIPERALAEYVERHTRRVFR